jgi:hypothetical protein
VNTPQTALRALTLSALVIFLVAGCNIPFLPRLEIDNFPVTSELIETMEVKEVVYVHVNNPKAAGSNAANPTMWVPMSVFQSGKFTAAKLELLQPETAPEQTAAGTPDGSDSPLSPETSEASAGIPAEATSEEQLSEAPAITLPLRRRALLFPSRTTWSRPEIATLLNLELEKKLPLRVHESLDRPLREQGRLLSQPDEIMRAVKTWLKKSETPAPVQFVLFLTSRRGRDCQFYTCTWVDAQTGAEVAAFTFRANLAGELLLPLVPTHPTPLERLVESSSWWCRIKSRPEDDRYILDAGHLSDLNYGRELKIFAKAETVHDPQNKNRLGFFFSQPLGTVSVTDFFAADGSIAQARTPLKEHFSKAWAVELVSIPEAPQDKAPADKTKTKPEDGVK